MSPFAALVGTLALARVTRLITADFIFDTPRRWVQAHAPWRIAYLLRCPWCLSVWLAPGFALTVVLWWHVVWVQVALGSLAGAHLTGLLALLDPPEDHGVTTDDT